MENQNNVNGQLNTNNQQPHKKKLGCLIAIIIVAVIAALVVVAFAVGIDSLSDVGKAESSSTTNSAKADSSTSSKVKKKELHVYKDEVLNIDYIDVYEEPDAVEGVVYLQLRVQNLSKQTVTLSLDNVAINGITTQSGTALPITLEPGKTTKTPFIIFTKNTDISSVKDIKKLEFSMNAMNDDLDFVDKTKTFSVSISKK